MLHSPIRYSDGRLADVGDVVTYHGERSIVEDVIYTAASLAEWGVDEPGLMLTNAAFGWVFVSPSEFEDDLVFVSRGP